MSDFGPIISRWTIVTDWLDEIRAWLPEYLAVYERQEGLTVGKTARPTTFVARHAGIVRSGEKPPAIVVWPAGVTDEEVDPDTNVVSGTLQLGLLVIAGANSAAATGDVLHRFTAALTALLYDRTTVAGHAADLRLVDEDFEGIEPDRERTLLEARLSYEAYGVLLGQRHAGPPPGSDPRRDPTRPWPPEPVAESADVQIVPIRDPEDDIPPI